MIPRIGAHLTAVLYLAASITGALSLEFGPANTNCDVGASAMNNLLPGVDIPRSCIEFNGRVRCFYTFVPECASGDTPLVFDMHPFMMCPSEYAVYSGWLQLAQKECFVVVWPIGLTDPEDSTSLCWATPAGNAGVDPTAPNKETQSCCCINGAAEDPKNPVDPEEVGDLEFVREIGSIVVNDVSKSTSAQVEINTRRIYMTGHSNGCYLSFGMSMRHSDFIAGTACMAGLWVTPPAIDYLPVPMWSVIGSLDVVAPPSGYDSKDTGYIPSYSTAFNNLMALNGCTGTKEVEIPVPDMNTFFAKGKLETLTATGCNNDATVEFLTLSTAGHTPYLGVPEYLPLPPFAASTTVDTTRLAWDFLSSFERETQPPEFKEIDVVRQVVTGQATLEEPVTTSPTGIPSASPSMRPTVSPTISL